MIEGREHGRGTGTHRDDDLLVGDRGAVACGKHARDRGCASTVDLDLVVSRERNRAFEPFGVRQQADLHEDAFEFDRVVGLVVAISVRESGDLLAVADDLGGHGAEDDVDVRQAAKLVLQHFVGSHLVGELEQGDVVDDAGQADRRFDTGVPATDHGGALALVERAVAVRTVGNASVGIFLFTGHAHVAPAGTGRDDDRACRQRGTALELDVVVAAEFGGRIGLGCPLSGDDVDVVLLDVLFQCRGQLGAFGVGDRHEVLDAECVEQLPAELVGDHGGTHALAGGVDGSRRAGRTTADDEDVERILCIDSLHRTVGAAGIDLGDQFFERHASLAEALAVAEHRGNRHHFTSGDFVLEVGTVDGDVGDVGIDDAHQVERLHHVGAVLARERHERLEVMRAFDGANLIEQFRIGGGGVSADLEECEHQGGELVAEGNPGEGDEHRGVVLAHDAEGRAAFVGALEVDGDVGGQVAQLTEQFGDLRTGRALIERCDQFNRLHDLRKVGAKRLGELGVEDHDQILPTRSSDGASVASPSSHLAGQTSFGFARTYCAAFTLRRSSVAERPMLPALISTIWILPSGSITKVPRSASPSSSIITPKLRVMTPVGSPTIGYVILLMVSEASCHALWVKCLSVDTA